jgi:hypothetical protein
MPTDFLIGSYFFGREKPIPPCKKIFLALAGVLALQNEWEQP